MQDLTLRIPAPAARTFSLIGSFTTWMLSPRAKEFIADMEHYPQQLAAELGRLRHMGLLGAKPGKGVGKLFSDPGRFKNLHDYVYVTDKGRAWLKMVRDVGAQEDAE